MLSHSMTKRPNWRWERAALRRPSTPEGQGRWLADISRSVSVVLCGRVVGVCHYLSQCGAEMQQPKLDSPTMTQLNTC